MPNAPELYQLELPGGPVQSLRTSQHTTEPGNRRMRITLMLLEPVRYEISKCDGGIDLRVPRPARAVWGEPWELDVDPGGITRKVVAHRDPPPRCKPETFDSAGIAVPEEEPAIAVKPAEGAKPGAPRPTPAPEAPPEPKRDQLEVTLESILADTTFFDLDPTAAGRTRALAWETAAGRLLVEAQASFLEGDTATCLDRLRMCDRFYPTTDPGRQAATLRHLILWVYGRFVEADLGPPPPREGPWPLLFDPVFERLLSEALRKGDRILAADVLRAWKQAEPDLPRWARAALRQAEAHLDAEEGERAANWVSQALSADPALQASPRALLCHAMSLVIQGRGEEAEGQLRVVEATNDSSAVVRARAARADIYYGRGRYRDAAEVYQLLARWETPAVEREWALYQLGNCWAALGDPNKARAYYTVAIESSPNGFWSEFAQMRLAELEAQGSVPARR
jgi:tetratricopeptide (TPR) repeat protein